MVARKFKQKIARMNLLHGDRKIYTNFGCTYSALRSYGDKVPTSGRLEREAYYQLKSTYWGQAASFPAVAPKQDLFS